MLILRNFLNGEILTGAKTERCVAVCVQKKQLLALELLLRCAENTDRKIGLVREPCWFPNNSIVAGK